MSEYSWINIRWNSDYKDKWQYAGQGLDSELFKNLQQCFKEVFGLNMSSTSDGRYFEAYFDDGFPTIKAKSATGSQIIISGLPPFAILRMRKAGSSNTSMQERIADVNGVVILDGGNGGYEGANVYYYFGEIAIGTSGYMWTTNSKLQTLNNFWHWCSEEGDKYTTTEYDATTKYEDNIYITHPINFLINDQSILGVRSPTPIQGTLKPSSQPTNWGFSEGWKYREFDGQVIEKPALNMSWKMKTDFKTYDTLESFAFVDKNKPIVVADNFASESFDVVVSSANNWVYYNENFTIPLDIENYDVYLIARKSTTRLIKGLKEIEDWENKNVFAPNESGYYIDSNSVAGSVRVGVWITEDTTIQTETTSELLYYKLDGHRYAFSAFDSSITIADPDKTWEIGSEDFTPVKGSSEENKIYSVFTKPTSFTYIFEDILDAEYARTGGGNQGIIMVRKNYRYYDEEHPSSTSYDFKVNWELKINNFTTLSDYRNITSYLNEDIYTKQNCVNIVTSIPYDRDPTSIMVSSLWSGICLKTFLNLLPKYINFLENSTITYARDYKVGDWTFTDAWGQQVLEKGQYKISHSSPCTQITVTSSDKGWTWAKFGQLSFGAYINNFGLLDTSGRLWELLEHDTHCAFAVVLMPKEFNPSHAEQLEPILPEEASLIKTE